MKILNSSIVIGKAMAITMYELLKSSEYYKKLKQLEEFNFLKHIRNGAAHNNRFHFKNNQDRWTLKEKDKIKWRDNEISIKLQGTKVFNDFISFTLVYILAYDFSEKLKAIDNK